MVGIGLVGHLVERFAVELVFVVTVEHHAVAFERLQRFAAVMDTVFEIGLRLVVLSREEARLGPESLGRPDGHAVVVGLREKPHGPVQIVDDGLVAAPVFARPTYISSSVLGTLSMMGMPTPSMSG